VKSVLVIAVGGTHIKVLATGQDTKREFVSGPALTPKRMVSRVKRWVGDWKYDAISIGYLSERVGRVSTSKPPSNARSRSSETSSKLETAG